MSAAAAECVPPVPAGPGVVAPSPVAAVPPLTGADVPFVPPDIGPWMGTGVAGRFEVCPSSASNPLPSVGFFWLMAADHNESRDAVMHVERKDSVVFGCVALIRFRRRCSTRCRRRFALFLLAADHFSSESEVRQGTA